MKSEDRELSFSAASHWEVRQVSAALHSEEKLRVQGAPETGASSPGSQPVWDGPEPVAPISQSCPVTLSHSLPPALSLPPPLAIEFTISLHPQ